MTTDNIRADYLPLEPGPFSNTTSTNLDDYGVHARRVERCLCITWSIFTAIGIFYFLHEMYNLSNLEFPKFEIDTLTVSNFNLSDTSINSHWNISVNITNVRSADASFKFSSNCISIFSESQEDALWGKELIPFDIYLNKSNVYLTLDFWGSSDNADNMTIKAIAENIANNGTVRFDVQFSGLSEIKIKYGRIENWFLWESYVIVSCKVPLFFKSSEKMWADTLINDSEACKLVYVDGSWPGYKMRE